MVRTPQVTAGGTGLLPGQGTKIAVWRKRKKERKKETKWASEESLILDKTGESPGSLPNSPLVTKVDDLLTSQTNQRSVLSGVFFNAELTNR